MAEDKRENVSEDTVGDETVVEQSTTALVPVKPKHLDASGEEKVSEEVQALVARAIDDPMDRGLSDQAQQIGVDAQKESSRRVELLQTKLGDLMKDSSEGDPVEKGLLDLRGEMDKINPHQLSKGPAWAEWLTDKFPAAKPLMVLGRIIPTAKGVMDKVGRKYETVEDNISAVKNGLRDGKDMLLQDNAELEELYQGVSDAQREILVAAWKGEMILQKLDEKIPQVTDTQEKTRLNALRQRVATRVQDLRTMEQANLQFFASIDMTMETNRTLSDQVDRTVQVVGTLLVVGLTIRAALQKQKRVSVAVQQTQNYAADMLVSNAKLVRQQGKEVEEMANQPVLALNKVVAAYDELTAALDETEEARSRRHEEARKAISTLSDMSQKLQPRVAGNRAASEKRLKFEGQGGNLVDGKLGIENGTDASADGES